MVFSSSGRFVSVWLNVPIRNENGLREKSKKTNREKKKVAGQIIPLLFVDVSGAVCFHKYFFTITP